MVGRITFHKINEFGIKYFPRFTKVTSLRLHFIIKYESLIIGLLILFDAGFKTLAIL